MITHSHLEYGFIGEFIFDELPFFYIFAIFRILRHTKYCIGIDKPQYWFFLLSILNFHLF